MTPKRPDDPDPFAETPLDPAERREMLEKLAAHMKPLVQPAPEDSRAHLRAIWDELREQETVESFKAQAEVLLAALQELPSGERAGSSVGDGGSKRRSPPEKLGGFLEPASDGATLGDWDRPVLKDLPPVSFPNPTSPP